MPQNTRIEQLKSFLKDSPHDIFLNYALATEYVSMGDEESAKKIFLQLMEWVPAYSPAYYHLGKLYERQEMIDEAKKTFEKGIEICMRNKEIKNLAEMQTALTNLLFNE